MTEADSSSDYLKVASTTASEAVGINRARKEHVITNDRFHFKRQNPNV